MDISLAPRSGRPRAFDRSAALLAARDLFWARGYEATSLDDLLRAMGISRSSFYATFGSKREALKAALTVYTEASLAQLHAEIAAAPDRQTALVRAVAALCDTGGGRRGCFFANCLTEFGAVDPEIDALMQAHLAALEAVFLPLIGGPQDGVSDGAPLRARLLLTQVLGLVALRKAGMAEDDLIALQRAMVDTVS